ncbi:MAG: hypothetical protein ACTHNM_11370 [Dyella sp.]|uniref:hypothetical protein n=1 Tax=Dyella sp. TaxID=1869338 RepID=UPI003F814EE2
MHTLKVSVFFPDNTHDDVQLKLSADELDGGVVIALPVRTPRAGTSSLPAAAPTPSASDDYELGGYAGI